MANEDRLRELAHLFLAESLRVLRQQHVVPPPDVHPHVQVGRDFFGPDLMGRAYEDLTKALDGAYPQRFEEPLNRRNPEFSNAYVFSLLEAAVARCSVDGDYSPGSRGCSTSIVELFAVLDADGYEVTCCRVVSHLRVPTADFEIEGVLFQPATDSAPSDRFIPQMRGFIPAVTSVFNREPPFAFDPPHGLLVARKRCSNEEEPFEAFEELHRRIEGILLRLRLLYAPTVVSHYEVAGLSTLVSRVHPQLTALDLGTFQSMVKRVLVIDGRVADGVLAMADLLAAAPSREGYATSSLTVALRKFHESFRPLDAFTQAIDLATGLEAILTGEEQPTEGIAFRLSSRAAALLGSADESASAVHRDVKLLYRLRSKLVHGGNLRERDLRKTINSVSTVTAGDAFGIAMAQAIDRFRDLLRRCIVARLALAKAGLWDWGGDAVVDENIADDNARSQWRSSWVELVTDLGGEEATRPASPAAHWLSQDE